MPPLAHAGADILLTYNASGYASTPLDGTLSTPGSGSSIVDYVWKILYQPPGATATISPASGSATPNLLTVGPVGTYVIHLQVENDLGEKSEAWTVPEIYSTTNQSMVSVAHKTSEEDWRIPGSWERNWTDIIREILIRVDDQIVDDWEELHQLFFTSGNDAEIRDDRPAASKNGLVGFKLSSTTGVNMSGVYSGIQSKPGKNIAAGAQNPAVDASEALNLQDADYGLSTLDTRSGAWRHTADPITGNPADVLVYIDATARDGDTEFYKIVNIELDSTLKGISDDTKLYALVKPDNVATTWGTTEADQTFGRGAIFWFDHVSWREAIFEMRNSEAPWYSQNAEEGIFQVHINANQLAAPYPSVYEQDFTFIRVIRHTQDLAPPTERIGADQGIVYRDDTQQASTLDKCQTWFFKRGDGQEFSIPMLAAYPDATAPTTRLAFKAPLMLFGRKRLTATGFQTTIEGTVTLNSVLAQTGNMSIANLGQPFAFARVSGCSTKPLNFVDSTYEELRAGIKTTPITNNLQINLSTSFAEPVSRFREDFSFAVTDNANKQTTLFNMATVFGSAVYIGGSGGSGNNYWLDFNSSPGTGDVVAMGVQSYNFSSAVIADFTLAHQRVQGARDTTFAGTWILNVLKQFEVDDWVDVEYVVVFPYKA
jgi:hypothetical protein